MMVDDDLNRIEETRIDGTGRDESKIVLFFGLQIKFRRKKTFSNLNRSNTLMVGSEDFSFMSVLIISTNYLPDDVLPTWWLLFVNLVVAEEFSFVENFVAHDQFPVFLSNQTR